MGETFSMEPSVMVSVTVARSLLLIAVASTFCAITSPRRKALSQRQSDFVAPTVVDFEQFAGNGYFGRTDARLAATSAKISSGG